jgi:flavodoxin short chain
MAAELSRAARFELNQGKQPNDNQGGTMGSALIIFGSTTGNTEFTAETIESVLSGKGLDTTLKNVTDAELDDLKGSHDIILLGASTWGDDEIEIQEDFEPFYEAMENGGLSLNGKKMAIFGCGDSSYEYFCGAVDVIEERVTDLGADVVTASLKIDGDPEEDDIQAWAKEVIQQL